MIKYNVKERKQKGRKKVHPTGKGPRIRGQRTDGRLLKSKTKEGNEKPKDQKEQRKTTQRSKEETNLERLKKTGLPQVMAEGQARVPGRATDEMQRETTILTKIPDLRVNQNLCLPTTRRSGKQQTRVR